MKLIRRLLFVPVTAFFLVYLLSLVERSLFSYSGYYFGYDSEIYSFLDFFRPAFFGLFVFWFISQILFEIAAFFREDFASSRLLKHLRYAPIAVLTFSFFLVITFDFGMIEYSKWRINRYVYSNSDSIEKPDFDVYVNYRGWCGNGYLPQRGYLYFETASSGLTSEDANVRARSLLMTFQVIDGLSESDHEKFTDGLKASCLDKDERIAQIADEILSERNISCSRFLYENRKSNFNHLIK